jgi:DNA replication protein DnaC
LQAIGDRQDRSSPRREPDPRTPITANQPFGEWGKIFADEAITLATIDRLVHHATVLEMNVESYRRTAALHRKRGKAAQPS